MCLLAYSAMRMNDGPLLTTFQNFLRATFSTIMPSKLTLTFSPQFTDLVSKQRFLTTRFAYGNLTLYRWSRCLTHLKIQRFSSDRFSRTRFVTSICSFFSLAYWEESFGVNSCSWPGSRQTKQGGPEARDASKNDDKQQRVATRESLTQLIGYIASRQVFERIALKIFAR